MEYISIIVAIILAYLIGSLPFSFLVAKFINKVDIRKVGSGNVGTTNVLRNCGVFSAALAFILDSSKGIFSFYLANYYFNSKELALALAIVTVIGHCYSIFLNFKGGKGVATSAGIILLINPVLFFILLGVFIIIVLISGYVSLGSIIVAFSFSFVYYFMTQELTMSLLFLLLGLFIVYRHKTNIIRLKNGNENSFRKKK